MPSQTVQEPDTSKKQPPQADQQPQQPPRPSKPWPPWAKWSLGIGIVLGIAVLLYFLVPYVGTTLNTVSTDDAYVNGHYTFVAPRVSGQVSEVLVDDNTRVQKGDLLVVLDKEPYRVQVAIRKAAVVAAETDLTAAKAQVRGLEALARSQRWQLQTAMEQVAGQVANLRANIAAYESRKATLTLARANLSRGEQLLPSGGISKEDLDQRRQNVKVDEAAEQQALQAIYATRVNLGLPSQPDDGNLGGAPADIEQTYSGVRTALASLNQTLAQIGLPLNRSAATPRQVLDEIRNRDARGDIDRFLEELVSKAPAVQQADAKLLQARRDLDQAELNLRYCDIVSEIDGVVARRNVNPGNNVQAGQSLMTVRSIREIWVDANFKETQLSYLRIGQRARLEVDMYGRKHEFNGRITGFTMGTGSAIALLPPENATGNFVKIVQRLPVRIELTDYEPEQRPLFVGLSVVPYVYYKEPASGPNAGAFLQPPAALPKGAPLPSAGP